MITEFDGKNAFLSNFFHSPFEFDGIVYPTNEHFFQAMKTLDQEERKKIAAAATPGKAKRMGRQVQLRDNWEDIKETVMRIGVDLKFRTHPELAEKLIATRWRMLIEGNSWHDNTWGSCFCPKCAPIAGKNLLGKILMEERQTLIEEGVENND